MEKLKDQLFELTKEAYFHYWKLRQVAREQEAGATEKRLPLLERTKPEDWSVKPPLSMGWVPLGRDLWEHALASEVGSLLLTSGDVSLGNNRGFDDGPIRIEDFERLPSLLRVWHWDWDDEGEQTEVQLVFPYVHEQEQVGSQDIGIYGCNYLFRTINLTRYFETGYEGHKREGTYELTESHLQFFIDLLEEAKP